MRFLRRIRVNSPYPYAHGKPSCAKRSAFGRAPRISMRWGAFFGAIWLSRFPSCRSRIFRASISWSLASGPLMGSLEAAFGSFALGLAQRAVGLPWG